MVHTLNTVNLRAADMASPQDMKLLTTLYASTRQQEMSASGWPQSQIDQFLLSQFEAQHAFYMEHYTGSCFDLIEIESQPAGRLYVGRYAENIIIIDIALLPAFQNRGVGAALIQQLQREASDTEKRLTIHVEHMNPAMTLYQRLGFYPVQLEGVYILMEWVDNPVKRQENRDKYQRPLAESIQALYD